MALQWDWKEKCGEITLVQKYVDAEGAEFKLSLYQGNAFLIMLHEWTDENGVEKYELAGFFADKQHAKNCLGLNKKGGYGENSYNTPYNRFTKLRLNKAKYRYTKDLVALFVEAFDEIEIELFTEEEDAA